MKIPTQNNLPKTILITLGMIVAIGVAERAWADYYYGPSIFSPVVYNPTRGSVFAEVRQMGSSKLATALKKAPPQLLKQLNQSELITIFVPTDEAFDALPPGEFEALLEPENQEKLSRFLSYHIITDKITEADIKAGEIKTLAGLPVRLYGNSVTQQFKINDAQLAGEPRLIKNAKDNPVILVLVDKVLIPPNF